MKKRILALILCLVMMVSLLPITAMALYCKPSDVHGIEGGKTYCGDTYFTLSSELSNAVKSVLYKPSGSGTSCSLTPDAEGRYKLDAGLGLVDIGIYYYCSPTDTTTERLDIFGITVNSGHTWGTGIQNGNGTHSHSCTVNGCNASETVNCFDGDGDHKCDDCGASVHTWQFTQKGNSLTATCQNSGCTIGEVSVKLNAHSVTLPESPFNATVEVSENFKEAFPNAQIDGPYYYYNGSEGYTKVDPNTFTPKAGEYQAQVYISGLPGNEVAELRAFSTDDGTELGGFSTSLWVDYTAIDPAVTAQTGDNRPIELVMGSMVVFAALAAAAFILDNKRRSHQ